MTKGCPVPGDPLTLISTWQPRGCLSLPSHGHTLGVLSEVLEGSVGARNGCLIMGGEGAGPR